MWILILLFLMPVPEQGGKVVLKVGVPAAEFYLDANFVAATDDSGTLTMESFPAGSFNYSIRAKGYKTYNSSFSIREGEDKMLSPVLEKISEPAQPAAKSHGAARSARSSAEKPRIAGKASPAAAHLQQAQVQHFGQPAPVDKQSPTEPSRDESRDSSSILIPIVLFAAGLSALGIWIWKMKSAQPQNTAMEAPAEAEQEEPPADVSVRPAPEFIEELKRREELINAGFVGSKPQVVDPDTMKEKEVVIELPKEAFRYEEDK